MKNTLLTCLYFLVSHIVNAQIPDGTNLYDVDSLRTGEWVLYYDSLDRHVVKDSAFVYCLLSFERGVPATDMTCYYTSGIKQWEGGMSSIDPDIKEGPCTYYSPLGTIIGQGTYKNNLATGQYDGYYENGQLQQSGLMKDGKNTGFWEYYHDNGQLMSKGNLVEGLQDGPWVFYFDNGQIQTQGIAKDGRYNGEWTMYFSNGFPNDISTYVDNKKNGRNRVYFESGQLASEGYYKDDQQHGDFSYFHENGQLQSQGEIREGRYEGKWDFYYANGNIASNRMYVDDNENGYFKYYFEDGSLKSEGIVKDNQWNGDVSFYYANGNIQSQGYIKKGKYEGPWLTNYESGARKINRVYVGDIENGLWEYFAENGTQTERGMMVNAKLDGFWEYYHPNGELSYSGTYKAGEKAGYFEYYNPDGSAIRKGKYNGELKQGPFEFFYDDDVLKSKGNYEKGNRVGHWIFYLANGAISTQGEYIDGKSVGYWKYYYPDGTLKKEGKEYDDKREGLWKYYHPNGQLNYSGQTTNGKGRGVWTYYDSLGRIQSKGKWEQDKRDSVWSYYDTLGLVNEVGSYENGKKQGKWWIYESGKKDHKELWDRGTKLNFWNLSDSSSNVAQKNKKDLALKIAKSAKRHWKKEYNKEDKNYHSYWRMMGTVHNNLGEYEKGEYYLRRSLEEVKRVETDTSWNYAIALADLGILYYDKRQFHKAVPCFEQAIEVVEQDNAGRAGDDYVNLLHRLAKSYQFNKESQRATQLLQKDLDYREENHPEQITSILEGQSILAEMYYRGKVYDSATWAFQRFFDYTKAHQITDHYKTSVSYRMMAYVHDASLQDDSSVYYYNKSIESHRHQNDTTTSNFALNYIGLAAEYTERKNNNIANSYADSALWIIEHNNLYNFSVYHEALTEKSKILANLNRNEEALDSYQTTIDVLLRRAVPPKAYLNVCYLGMGNNIAVLHPSERWRAEEWYLKAVSILEGQSIFQRNYFSSMLTLSKFYRDNKEYTKAQTPLLTLEQYLENINHEPRIHYGRIYRGLARIASNQFEYDTAKFYFRKAISYFNEKNDLSVIQHAIMLDELADIEENLDHDAEALKLITESLTLLKEQVGTDHHSYIGQLYSLAIYHRNQSNYQTAIILLKQVKAAREKQYGTQNDAYVNVQRSLVIAYRLDEDFDNAQLEAKSWKSNILSYALKTSDDYLSYLEEMGDVMRAQGKYEEAKVYYEEMRVLAEKRYGKQHEDYAFYVRQLGRFYKYFGKNEEALVHLKTAINILAATQGTGNQKYAWVLESIGEVYYSMENYKEALTIKDQVLEIYKTVYGYGSWYHRDALSSMASLHERLGRYPSSEKLYLECLEMIDNRVGKNTTEYTESLRDIAMMYQWWGKPKIALAQADLGIHILDSIDAHQTRYFGLYNVMGMSLERLKDYEKAKSYYVKAREGALTHWGKKSSYFLYTNNLAFIYMEQGDFDTAEQLFLEAGSRFDKYEKVQDLELVNHEDNLATLYLAWGKMELAEEYWTRVTDVLLKRINANFAYMSESEKANFWNAYKKDFEYFNSYALKASASIPKAIGQMYDNQLQTKSILLSSSTKERSKIINSGDSTLVKQYFRYIDLKEDLARYYGYTPEQLLAEGIQVDSLEKVANGYEKELSLNAAALAKEQRAKNIRWKDIQRKLGPDEATVEIIRFRHFDKYVTDSVLYVALILTNETRKSPTLVVLPNGNELESKYMKNYLSSVKYKVEDEHSYKQYWKEIDRYLSGKSVVYFSPDGVYNQLNVNTFQQTDGQYVLDQYNLHIMTSTKDVVLLDQEVKEELGVPVASLFGFPKYDLKHSAIATIVKERSLERSRTLERDIDLTRFGFAELPGTKTETESIAEILLANQWETALHLGHEALEEVIKAVKNPNILHIATHGFFLDDVEHKDQLQLGVSTKQSRKNPLLRSGLLLAGAAQTVQGEYQNKTENGILTAYEAMNLDLDGTDLVVLSACETGRGEVKSGEGVYGLQRSFQIAGAESLIMSLWKVNDEATQLLMTNFYRNWLSGLDKNAAFKKAQSTVRSQFPEPYYWGAFVMVGN